MKWKAREDRTDWELVFALVPHRCFDTQEIVWLEHVWRKIETSYLDCYYVYRYML